MCMQRKKLTDIAAKEKEQRDTAKSKKEAEELAMRQQLGFDEASTDEDEPEGSE